MSKIKSKEEFKERDEIEEYFSEVKNKSFPTWIVLVLILLLIIGGFCYYYFIIDSPKNIFLTVINDKFNNITLESSNHKKINYEFNLDTNVKTNNKDYIDEINIIKEISLSGIGGIDLDTKENITKLNTFYKGEKLLDLDIYSKNDSISLKSPQLYEKVINLNSKEINQTNKTYNVNLDNFEVLVSSLKNEIKVILNKGTYQKEYTNLNNNIVKKVTLLIDKTLIEELYNNLLDNNEFIESSSKLSGTSKSDVKKQIQDEINNIDDETNTISLYVSILENKLLMLEMISEEERITITKEENQYTYKFYDDSIIKYQGYISILKTNNNYEISISYDDIEEELNIILNLDLSLEYDKDIEKMDITNAINYQDLTKEDKNKIMNNLQNNKIVLSLFEDITSLYAPDTSNTEEQVTTTA